MSRPASTNDLTPPVSGVIPLLSIPSLLSWSGPVPTLRLLVPNMPPNVPAEKSLCLCGAYQMMFLYLRSLWGKWWGLVIHFLHLINFAVYFTAFVGRRRFIPGTQTITSSIIKSEGSSSLYKHHNNLRSQSESQKIRNLLWTSPAAVSATRCLCLKALLESESVNAFEVSCIQDSGWRHDGFWSTGMKGFHDRNIWCWQHEITILTTHHPHPY